MSSPDAVSLEKVSFTYEHAAGPALRGVTLRVPVGQCCVLAGSSGCGKTTVTRLLNGLIPLAYRGAFEGRAAVGGVPVSEWSMEGLCRAVGSVFQNPRSQFFNLDTTSEVAFGCENIGLTREEVRSRVQATFAALGVEHLRERDIAALSGGQRQMLAIACAWAPGPDLFVLDEPTASLDVASMRQLSLVVKRLKALGKTVVVAEHRLWWLADLADRVVVMQDGRVALDQSADAFARLGAPERASLGLRAWSLEGVAPAARKAPREGGEAPAVELEALHAGYRAGPEALRGASARFGEGRAIALIGRNGAGKTTLARCMVGLHKQASGVVRFGSCTPKRARRADFAYLVMQESGYQLFSDSVRGELRAALTCGETRPEPKGLQDVVEGALARFGLEALAERHPLSLSGGQRQRLAIAAGLLQGARTIVLDEPTSGLDWANMQRIAQEIRRACDGGACVVVLTHDYELICSACDEAVVLDGGLLGSPLRVGPSEAAGIREHLGLSP